MNFLNALKQNTFLLYDGPMETRIEYDTSIQLHKDVSIFRLIYQDVGREALSYLYQTDIEVAGGYDLPIILNAPTWRASFTHIECAGYKDKQDVEIINQDCIQFVKEIRKKYPNNKIFITAPIGPELTDYKTNPKLTVDKAASYHQLQAKAVAKTGVDIISIAAMPGMIEAIGCAKAVAETNLPYSVGVVLNKDGSLLDGNTFKDLIHRIDETVSPVPNFYVISCTHPANVTRALSDNDPAYLRILGIKANGSNKSVKELLDVDHPIADEPEIFADELIALGKQYHFKIFGGCCGTDHRHLEALARKLTFMMKSHKS